jgi:SpoVK/Ycf46/Vps4 family AAA+-type ATPase
VRRIYIPLPDADSRRALVSTLLARQGAGGAGMLAPRRLDQIVRMTEGYSGSDLTAVRAVACACVKYPTMRAIF